MANISSFSGTILFDTSDSKATPEDLKKLIKVTESWDYLSLESISHESITTPYTKHWLLCNGRWNMCSCVPRFFEWVSNDQNTQDLNLKKYDNLKITFEGADFENGCGVFCDAKITICAHWDGKLSTEVIEEDILDIPITAKNLEKEGIFEEAGDTFTPYGLNNILKRWNTMKLFNHTVTMKELTKFIHDLSFENLTEETDAILGAFESGFAYRGYSTWEEYQADN